MIPSRYIMIRTRKNVHFRRVESANMENYELNAHLEEEVDGMEVSEKEYHLCMRAFFIRVGKIRKIRAEVEKAFQVVREEFLYH